MAKKSDKTEIKRRISKVQDLLLEGNRSNQIIEYAKENWSIAEAQTYNYIKEAWDEFSKIKEADRDRLMNYHILARMNLFKKAYDKENWGVCREILKDMAQLQGLYVVKHSFTDPTGEQDYGALTVDEMVKRLVAILQSTNGEFLEK